MAAGIVMILLAVLVIAQVTRGQALQRLGVVSG
jgi:hypothetical protein